MIIIIIIIIIIIFIIIIFTFNHCGKVCLRFVIFLWMYLACQIAGLILERCFSWCDRVTKRI